MMLILLIALAVLIGATALGALAGYWSLLVHLPSSNADFDCFLIREAEPPALSAGARRPATRLASTTATAAHAA
jgi:hypothetical protein